MHAFQRMCAASGDPNLQDYDPFRPPEPGGFNKSAGGSRGSGAGLIGAPAPGNGGGRLGRDIGS